MAKLVAGIDLSGNELTFTIPSNTAVATARTIATLMDDGNGRTYTLKEEPVAGQGGKVVLYDYANRDMLSFTFPASGGTYTWTDIYAVVSSVDTGAVLYNKISRRANVHYYALGEDGARREVVTDLGQALSNSTTELFLPAEGDYLIVTFSPQLAGYSSIWTVRYETGRAHPGMKLGGDGAYISNVRTYPYVLQIAITNDGPSVVRVYAIRLK